MSAIEQVKRTPVESPLSLKELAIALVKHYKLKKGAYDLLLEYQIGTGGVGPDKDSLVPGVMIGVCRVGLVSAAREGPNSVDAAEIYAAERAKKKPAVLDHEKT